MRGDPPGMFALDRESNPADIREKPPLPQGGIRGEYRIP